MTWILPKQLHTSAFVPDTGALISDLNEQSQVCEQSLLVRSKRSPLRTWLLKWKRDSWTQHLSGRILKPSLGHSFAERWTSCLVATLASHFQQQDSAEEQKTQGTCGQQLQTEFPFFSQPCASLKTSKDTSALDCRMSSETWAAEVTRRRGAYSARLKSALRTNASGCSSWPTSSTRDHKGGYNGGRIRNGKVSKDTLDVAVQAEESGLAAQANPSMDGSRLELWPTATAVNRVRNEETMAKCAAFRKRNANQNTVPVYLEEKVLMEQKAWATPRVCSAMAATITAEAANDPKRFPNLETQVGKAQWATPQTMDGSRPIETMSQWQERNAKKKAQNPNLGTLHKPLTVQVSGKLNPRWVETLMGLPVGWVMPSCASPAITALTNSDCSATALCQPAPQSPSQR